MQYVDASGGSSDVYERIAGLTECKLLHAEFDQALRHNRLARAGSPEHRISLGYMRAAGERMAAIGCYDLPRTRPL